MYLPGSVILLDNENGNVLSKLIRFFSSSKISHTDFVLGYAGTEESVLSAEALISVLPLKSYFSDDAYTFTIYTILGVPGDQLQDIATKLYVEFAGKIYPFLALFWFIYRWLMEKVHVDVRKQKNWIARLGLCSELVYVLLVKLADGRFPDLAAKLGEWNQTTVWPEDIRQIVLAFPSIFQLTTTCVKTVVTQH